MPQVWSVDDSPVPQPPDLSGNVSDAAAVAAAQRLPSHLHAAFLHHVAAILAGQPEPSAAATHKAILEALEAQRGQFDRRRTNTPHRRRAR